jgi:hypothetical protein
LRLGSCFLARISRIVGAIVVTIPAIHAGVITGTVLEQQSGRPLARTVVQLLPIPKSAGDVRKIDDRQSNDLKPLQTRAESSGVFTFPAVPDGLYLIIATREYYFRASYGQKRPSGQGMPVQVTGDSNLFAELRMRRMGVVTGRVLDENDIGMPDVGVVAYRARFPLHSVGRGVSDDRGVYRIFNLEPGKYWVRTVAHTLDDGSGRLPTFGSETMETRDARMHEVRVDEETAYADLRPVPGKVFQLGGRVMCPLIDSEGHALIARVTLSSETERKTTQVPCGDGYRFQGLAPAVYEILAETKDGYAGFVEQFVDRNLDSVSVNTAPSPQVDIELRKADTRGGVRTPITLMGHRQDLSDLEKDQPIAMHDKLAPGHWLMSARVGATQYVESIMGATVVRDRRPAQPSDAFDVMIGSGFARIVVTISDRAAQIDGSVVGVDSKAIPGAPVFLWPVTEAARRSIGGTKLVLTDVTGRYQFDGLPPGDYRVLATFDVSEVDAEILDLAGVAVTRLEIGQRLTAELPLWIAP